MAAPQKSRQHFNMEELCVSFITRNRFYATLLSKLNKESNPSIQTCDIGFSSKGKLTLRYNEDYFMKWNLAEGQALIEHELLHIVFRHLYRLPPNKDPQIKRIQNIAVDMAIDQYLPEVPDAILPEKFNLEREQSAEWYFAELMKQEEKKQQDQKKQQGGKGKGNGSPQDKQDQDEENDEQDEKSDEQDGDQEGKGNDKQDDKKQDKPKRGTHDLWDKELKENGEVGEASENENCDMEHELDKIVKQAAKECEGHKSMGELPSGVRKELEALANPKKRHDWKKSFKIFVNTIMTTEKASSHKRMNKRLIGVVDYIMPGKRKQKRPILLVARDTSGSVFSDEMQKQFLNEIIVLSRFCDIWLVDCDTKAYEPYQVRSPKDFKPCEGGGGTAFEPVFEIAKKKKVDGVIYLTDTHGSFPEIKDIGKFAYKTLWVTVNQEKVEIPFGKHINIIND